MPRKAQKNKYGPALRSTTLATPCVVEDILELRDNGNYRVDGKTYDAEQGCSVWARGFDVHKDPGPGQFIGLNSPTISVLFGFISQTWVSIDLKPSVPSKKRRRSTTGPVVPESDNRRLLVEYAVDEEKPVPPPPLPPLTTDSMALPREDAPAQRMKALMGRWPLLTAALAIVIGLGLGGWIVFSANHKPEKPEAIYAPRSQDRTAPQSKEGKPQRTRTLFPNMPRE